MMLRFNKLKAIAVSKTVFVEPHNQQTMTTATRPQTAASLEGADARRTEDVKFQYHPRLIRALGAELVTSDIVAIIELVKNSYDAFAHNVTIRFAEDSEGEYIEILDDGLGMTRDVIENAWFKVATPHKVDNPTTKLGARQRRVSGDKGLGRLSAARLGNRLEMITKARNDKCWNVDVLWSRDYGEAESADVVATIQEVDPNLIDKESGTRIRISELSTGWTGSSIGDLGDSLARLISPFGNPEEFNITLESIHVAHLRKVLIESPPFLAYPPYRIEGSVNAVGDISATYFHAINGEVARKIEFRLLWPEVYDNPIIPLEESNNLNAVCGPFNFEIRAWDLNPDERREISAQYNITAREIQRSINSNKGISLYRDHVLVLPKTDHAKDWLGLDARRIQRVGPRIGTRNVIGQVNIRADANPDIRDTSDREALASNPASDEFRCILMAAVSRFESERNADRMQPMQKLNDVFSAVSAESVLRRARTLERQNASVAAIVPAIERHAEKLSRTRKDLRGRFVYYSRVAALGQMAHMLVHEVRNRTTSIGAFLRRVSDAFNMEQDHSITRSFQLARGSVGALETLADKLAPLASRSFKRSRTSIVEEQMRDCIDLLADELREVKANCAVPNSRTHIAVDPGELTHVLYNLVDNAAYWLGQVRDRERRIELLLSSDPDSGTAMIRVRDNGPGIDSDYEQRVFAPGYTMKPHGTGMGLTVASELVEAWGGFMRLQQDEVAIGASFEFSAPLV